MSAPRPPEILIGPRDRGQESLATILEAIRAGEQSASQFADAMNSMDADGITPEFFRDLQSKCEDWYWSQRQIAQGIYAMARAVVAEQNIARAARLHRAANQWPEDARIPLEE